MIRPEEKHLQKIMDLFAQCGLDSVTMEKIETYLEDGQEETLRKITERDLSTMPLELKREFSDVMTKAIDRERYEEAERLFEVLFTLGGLTMFDWLGYWWGKLEEGKFSVDPSKAAAIHANMVANNQFRMSAREVKGICQMAGNDIENLKKAMDYTVTGQDKARLMLYVAYFYLKYPAGDGAGISSGSTQKEQGFLGKVKKLFGSREDRGISVLEEDGKLLESYEELILGSLSSLLGSCAQNTPESMKRLAAELRKEKVSGEVLARYWGAPYDKEMMKLLGGCAFANFSLSGCLQNVVSFCLAIDAEAMFSVMDKFDLRMDLAKRGGSFDEVFGIDTKRYIGWAAKNGRKRILTEQFKNHRDLYIEYYNMADHEAASVMTEIMRESDPGFYEKFIGKSEVKNQRQDKLIEVFVGGCPANRIPVIRDYLLGNTEMDSLYPIKEEIKVTTWYAGKEQRKALEAYYRIHRDEGFYNRCYAFCILRGYVTFCDERLGRTFKTVEKELAEIFRVLDAAGMDVAHQLSGLSMIEDHFYAEEIKEAITKKAPEVFAGYLKERREETVAAFAGADAYGRCIGVRTLAMDAERNKEDILKYAADSAKSVKEELLSVLEKQRNWHDDILSMLGAKKAADREMAVRVLISWKDEQDLEALQAASDKEKSAKLAALLREYLSGGESKEGEKDGEGKMILNTDLVKELHKGGKKRSLAWAYEKPFPMVHKKDGSEAGEEYLQAILISYVSMGKLGVNKTAAVLAGELIAEEFAVYVNELFDRWMELGAEAKKRWVLYAAAQHGSADIVVKLEHQIKEWPANSRGAIAAEAVQALALSPEPQALLIVDSIARKFKFKQVRAAAGKALEYAAEQLGLTRAQLEDKIVPDLGFDEHMERHFDYGERQFTVTITPSLEIEVFDASGKKLKNLPAPGKKDDEEKAAAAYSEFKQMKKQMKTTVASQKMRLEAALSAERLWTAEAWQELFVKNPIMHQFAIGLIWGVYEEHRLTKSFRYMEDGSFNTEEEEEYEFPENASIGLVHPVELTAESIETWKEQLADYEITQPFEQLERPVFYRTKEEEGSRELERFGGMILNDLSLSGKLQTLGWYKGAVLDAGCIDTYYREDTELGYGVSLFFSGSYVGGMGEEVTVYEAAFYPAGKTAKEIWWNEKHKDDALLLKDVPERYFSEIILQLTKATASSQEKDEGWKKSK
ncbi:MAG: DUF4132 domain-containing protein [Lachnospiraceae bacterium]|nr:DUF4132 domain-containing protein [Lachnospiraceae bacterium]